VRILQVVPSYLPGTSYGGPVASVHGLSRALVELGHDVTVFTTDRDGWTPMVRAPERASFDGVEVRYFPARFPTRVHRAPSMRTALRAALPSYDVCHLHGVFTWPVTCAAREAERAGVPYVLSPRGMLVRELIRRRGRVRKELWLRAFDRRTVARAAWLHATSELEAADLAELGLPATPVVVIENGVEPLPTLEDSVLLRSEVREVLGRDDLILFVGRLSWKKGLERLVRALSELERGHLVVAGGDHGFGDTLRRRVTELGLDARVTLVGEVAGPEKAALYRSARVLALPSDHENFGNVVTEAMSAALPVVVTRTVGAAPLVAAAGAGRVVDLTPESIAEALSELLADDVLREALGQAGLRAALETLSWTAIAERFEARYGGR
jgi:glycosyltransferase involved in cell wall biosynthesis